MSGQKGGRLRPQAVLAQRNREEAVVLCYGCFLRRKIAFRAYQDKGGETFAACVGEELPFAGTTGYSPQSVERTGDESVKIDHLSEYGHTVLQGLFHSCSHDLGKAYSVDISSLGVAGAEESD